MGKKLVLAEKPSVARDLAKIIGANEKHKNYYEGKNYIVTWAYGHLLTLKMPEDINKEWHEWKLETLPMIPKKFGIKPLLKTGGQLKAIASLSKRADVSGMVVATDSGRAGELLARFIIEWIRFNKPIERLWISSQTKKAVSDGFKNLTSDSKFNNLYQSELARTKADWLIGLNVSRALSVKYSDNLSAGRVQTPTLAFISKREETINKFVPENYYTIELRIPGVSKTAKLTGNKTFKTKEEAENFIKNYSEKIGKVIKEKEKLKKVPAPLPFDLTELQQVANQQFGFSAKRTLTLVQSLYETHKNVTYPRTDSKYLPQDVEATLKERVSALVSYTDRAKEILKTGAKVVKRSVFNDAKVTDHYALIPTEQRVNALDFSSDEAKIFRLITNRFLGLFMPEFVTKSEKYTIEFSKELVFSFSNESVVESGWKFDMVAAPTETMNLTSVKADFVVKKNTTQPPKPLTEADVLSKIEKFVLGTPATRAEIIEKLVNTNLCERNGNVMRTTAKGRQLLQLVNKDLVTPDLTADWERTLEKIARGKVQPDSFLKQIEGKTREFVSEIKNSEADYKDFSLTNKICPVSGDKLREKKTRDGIFYVCSNPECSYRRRKEPKVSNHRCPQCHRKMEIIEGKNGSYFSCKYDGTTEKMLDKKERKKKMTKNEERKLLKKINNSEEKEENAFAALFKNIDFDK
jgi:DNA topoisomerase-3